MDIKEYIHNILNLIKDSDTIADSFINYNKIPQVEIDLLKEKVRNLYEQIIILDKKNNKVSEEENIQDDEEFFEIEENKEAPAVDTIEEEEEEPAKTTTVSSEEDIELIKKMYEQLVASGKISEPIQEEQPVVIETHETYKKQEDKKTAEPLEKPEAKKVTEKKEKTVKVEIKKEQKLEKQEQEISDPPLEIENTLDKTDEVEELEIQEIKPEPVKEKKEPAIAEEPKHEPSLENATTPKSINDIIAKNQSGKMLASKLQNKPIKDIKTAIGINDKFQLIRELFDGSAEKFAQTVDHLNGLSSFEEAYTYCSENYNWDEEETIVIKFLELINRRYL